MKWHGEPSARQPRVRDRQRGQALLMAASLMVAFFAASAVVIDIGFIYYAYEQLVASTDAAALAGGTAISNGNAVTVAAEYSSLTGDKNASPNLQSVTETATLECLTAAGLPNCLVFGTQPSANAIVVTQKATVSTYFARIFGINSLKISASATASAKGGGGGPYNVLMVIDTTQSMSTPDTNCTVPGIRTPTREQCAQYGVQILLSELNPCPSTNPNCVTGSSLSGNANVTGAVDEVGLMTFPGLTPQSTTLSNPPVQAPTASDDYNCPTSSPSITPYNNNPGYLVLPLGSNYRASNNSTALNTSANIVTAVGGGKCNGMGDPGGEGTFYAGAIAAAQSYLTSASRTNVQNVMILLSDGDASATACVRGIGDLCGSTTSYSPTAECQQAVTASNNAKAAGILVYSVAYGSETTGCTTGDSLNPCTTMEGIASTPTTTYFFSDYNQSGSGIDKNCIGRDTTNLNQIFTDIGSDLTTARLLPNNTP